MSVPLCIDLDGTLVKTDLLLESLVMLLKKNPLYFFLALYWFIHGFARLKHEIAKRVTINPATLPYSTTLLLYLKEEYAKGRVLALVTAADQKIAHAIADYLGVFKTVLASDGVLNLRGDNKRRMLDQIFGHKQYDYAGNEEIDLKIWSSSRHAIVVNANQQLVNRAKQITTVEKFFPHEENKFIALIKAIRIHQYVKNLLVFAPLFVSHSYLQLSAIKSSAIAFISFCLLASSVYLINDLVDLESDRLHRTKHKRPIAAGNLSIFAAVCITFILLITGLCCAATINSAFLLVMISYFLLTCLYSLYLKKQLLIDVFALAMLYTIRIIAGIAAIQSVYSEWLLSFSLFIFLSLAFVKRYSELYLCKLENKAIIPGRNYQINDLSQIALFGTVSGYLASLVFAFYISSNKVTVLYHNPQWLWLICLFLLYWISRIWMLAVRGIIHEDPIVFALKDQASFAIMIAVAVTVFLAY